MMMPLPPDFRAALVNVKPPEVGAEVLLEIASRPAYAVTSAGLVTSVCTVTGKPSVETGSGFVSATSPSFVPSAPWISLMRWYCAPAMSSVATTAPVPGSVTVSAIR